MHLEGPGDGVHVAAHVLIRVGVKLQVGSDFIRVRVRVGVGVGIGLTSQAITGNQLHGSGFSSGKVQLWSLTLTLTLTLTLIGYSTWYLNQGRMCRVRARVMFTITVTDKVGVG